MYKGHISAQVTVWFWSDFDFSVNFCYKSLYETKIACSAFRLEALKQQQQKKNSTRKAKQTARAKT